MCAGPDTGPGTCRVVFAEGIEGQRQLSSWSLCCEVLLGPCSARLCACVCMRVHMCVHMRVFPCMHTPVFKSDPVWKCVSVPGPVWVFVLHMGLSCVYLHICLSPCAWTPLCMSVLAPQVSKPYVHIHLGRVNSLCMGGKVAPCPPHPRGPPRRARLCKRGQAWGSPWRVASGDWRGLLPQCIPAPVHPRPSTATPRGRTVCPFQSPVTSTPGPYTVRCHAPRFPCIPGPCPPALPPASAGAWGSLLPLAFAAQPASGLQAAATLGASLHLPASFSP